MRKMATVREISELRNIEGADRIQAYKVDGWWVIDQKDKYKEGDKVIYCEIDSWIPNSIAPFLSKGKEPREYKGIKGEKLKTIKLKGQISQGLLLPLDLLYSFLANKYPFLTSIEIDLNSILGFDVSEILDINKWEPKEYLGNNREARKGGFPSFIPKTDQERIQNLSKKFEEYKKYTWEVTEKLDGSSMTIYYTGEDFGICSRNINLKESKENRFWYINEKYDILNKLKQLNQELAIQGELVGPKVQNNPYNLDDLEFYVFDIWEISDQRYLTHDERINICKFLELKHVPIDSNNMDISKYSIDDLLEISSIPSSINPAINQEGFVFKCIEKPNLSFKVISNSYLLK